MSQKRAAIYARVSTIDRGQDPETQLRQLREFAERRGFALIAEYVDHASGSKNDRERPALAARAGGRRPRSSRGATPARSRPVPCGSGAETTA